MRREITVEKAFEIIKRVAERTGGIIEPCLVEELCHYADQGAIQSFCQINEIKIADEKKRTDYNVTHSKEMVLALQVRRDVEGAYDQLSKIYEKNIKCLARRRCNAYLEYEDAVQEIQLTILELLKSGRIKLDVCRSIMGAIYKQTKLNLHDAYNEKYRPIRINHNITNEERNKYDYQVGSLDDESNLGGQEKSSPENVEDTAILNSIVEALPEQDRFILEQIVMQRKTQKEVAEELGCTQVNVSKKLKRILSTLRTELTV